MQQFLAGTPVLNYSEMNYVVQAECSLISTDVYPAVDGMNE